MHNINLKARKSLCDGENLHHHHSRSSFFVAVQTINNQDVLTQKVTAGFTDSMFVLKFHSQTV